MNKQINKTLVPKLRFPDFQYVGEWEQIKFIDVADKKVKWSFIGGPFGSNLKSSDYVAKGIRIIQLQNIGDGEFKDKYKIFTSEDKANELLSNNIYPGDIILSKMGDPVGRACLIPDIHQRYVMCSDGIRVVVNEKLFSKYFIYLLINSKDFRGLVENAATGSTRKRIGLVDLKKLPMIVPKIEEQQKVADCLSSIDELITAQNQEIEPLKAHKNGLMQQLFPSEGETVPKLRFPEFQDAWKKKKLIDTADKKIKWSFIGGPFGSNLKSSDYVVEGIRIIQLQNIGDGKFKNDYKIFTSEQKADELLANNIYPNDIILSKMGDPVGRACLIPNNHKRYVMCSDGIRLAVDEKLYNKYFIYSLINSAQFRSMIENTATGSTRKRIGLDQLKKLPMLIPNIQEQQKIADCLSSIDELITTQSQKIEALNTHKKGLIQQLFPSKSEGIA